MDELTLARRQADEYAREADALRAENARLNARVLDLEQRLGTARDVEIGLTERSAARGESVEQLRAENAKLRRQRDKCAEWAGVDLSELEERYP